MKIVLEFFQKLRASICDIVMQAFSYSVYFIYLNCAPGQYWWPKEGFIDQHLQKRENVLKSSTPKLQTYATIYVRFLCKHPKIV